MIRLLKYLLPILFTVAMCGGEGAVSEVSADNNHTEVAVLSVIQATVSPAESEICLPRQVSAPDSLRLLASARRATSFYRNSVEVARARRPFTHSYTMVPSFRLHLLGRLII